MQIEIDGKSYAVPANYVQKLADDLFARMEQMYEIKIGDSTKVGLMAITRAMLVKEELSVRMKYGKEAARAVRPPPKADPNIWLARQFLPVIRDMLNDTTLICETTAETITNFTVAIPDFGQSRGQVDTTGSIGLREDNDLKVS